MTRRDIPCATLVLTAAYFSGQFGLDMIYLAFPSNEQLSRTIASALLLMVIVAAACLAILQVTVRIYWHRRRSRELAGG